MRRSRFYAEPADQAEVNLTPLIDVVFVILITFIVVAPMLEIDEITLAPGKGQIEEVVSATKSRTTLIHVKADDTILVGGQAIHIDHLDEVLAQAHATSAGTPPQLFQDRNAHFGTYQIVKNAAERAGFAELELVLQPQ